MKPRVYSLFCIVVAYFFNSSCGIILCLILSSLPCPNYRAIYFAVRYHLLDSPAFITFLYPAPSFVLLSLCDPSSCCISLFVLDGLEVGPEISPPTLPLKYSCRTDFFIVGQGKIGIVFPIGMARVSCPSVSSGFLGIPLPLLCPCLTLQPLIAGLGFLYSCWSLSPLQQLLWGFLCPRGDLRHATLASSSRKL